MTKYQRMLDAINEEIDINREKQEAINEIYAFYKVNSKRTFLFINRNRVQILCIEAFGIIDSIEVIRLITPITLGGHIEKILKIIEYKRNLKEIIQRVQILLDSYFWCCIN